MPKVSEKHRVAMRERIQQAALACVAEKGFSNVSMGDIIAEAGLSAGAVYVYYRSKEELIVDAGQRVFAERMAALEGLGGEGAVLPPEQAIVELMTGLMQMDFFPGVAVQVWGEAVRNDRMGEVARSILAQIRGHIETYLEAWLRVSRPAEDAQGKARLLAPAVMGLIQGCAVQCALAGEDVEAAYLESARTLLAGI
ncbi:TetR/AcrR family transcriptional regulator [Pseudarthrobacter sp. fls2-241-R2A-127]|uniref:TetR/AcrR family transcriptional regulator n=1 Tax=Pseudarthrobacter sp. fls2-241-R2A-127 TaxID=3040303 RepID=UPI002552F2C7|nr:TetR/AcrR family transcriptional regulator [Pseudarthrobacter sp. fls2-241-R2A-127]